MHHSAGPGPDPAISIILCARAGEECLAGLLDELARDAPQAEVIVAAPEIDEGLAARHRGVIWVRAAGGRARQLNGGARAATGEVLLFLHADSSLCPGALQAVGRALKSEDCVGGAFALRLAGRGISLRLIETAVALRVRFLGRVFGDQGIFLLRQTWEALGGYRELEIMEDADLVSRARRMGRFARLPETISTSTRRWRKNGVLRTTAVNGLTQLGHGLGVSSTRLRRFYDRWLGCGGSEESSRAGRGGIEALVLCGCAIMLGSLVLRPSILTRFFGPSQVTAEELYQNDPQSPRFDHKVWDNQVARIVDAAGMVDYESLRRDPTGLDLYIEQLAAAPFEQLDRDQKLALLINAYNAFTLRLILDHYTDSGPSLEEPLAPRSLKSIRHIPKAQRWAANRWSIGSLRLSLEEIENDYLRKRFVEARIHFAINCASRDCPALRPRAFLAEKIGAQLEAQALAVHSAGRFANFDAATGKLHLNSIYDWYRGDFLAQAESLEAYAARFMPKLRAALARGQRIEIVWKNYDWSLNASD
jgi:rSAM/selenodomain-associated transferase 2